MTDSKLADDTPPRHRGASAPPTPVIAINPTRKLSADPQTDLERRIDLAYRIIDYVRDRRAVATTSRAKRGEEEK